MTDREKIVSDNYYDVLSDYSQPEELPVTVSDYVFQPIDRNLGVSYINRSEIDMLSVRDFTYRSIPKIYGLQQIEELQQWNFDPTSLMRSGVLQVQREPLNLTGRGVVLGFLDTGERVIIMSS